MNSKQLRRSLKIKWLTYYRDNREWIDKLGIWVTSNGQRRPSSGFILGALATLEPDLTNLLPLVVDLSSNPDRIISALGLDISPVKELAALEKAHKMLPGSAQTEVSLASAEPLTIDAPPPLSPAHDDDACSGAGGREDDRPRP
ncbi:MULTISPECIES: DUF5331 domain-containing protein [Cyanophyceae]|uniref:DUF5331 domain-containing protein n=1 Tax=Cyanophyceae TaxID=3028117 RepID=UPI00168325A3|nr:MULTISPECIES: DUF5331 domain-containing protein [unclassified Phormidium]MBD1915756.1 hypothetical protein [Phormidium sp. FACHB-77]MBD2030057.1 hypothetical protein [Phormidium sp. FACHB-322]MBD2052169.1 hypothetical protein [Leptolyngbya sp. FACHB-60]